MRHGVARQGRFSGLGTPLSLGVALSAFIPFVVPLHAQSPSKLWGETGLPVVTARGSQFLNASISDGAGGVIAAWLDQRASNGDIFVQRLDANGTPLWTLDGAALTFDAVTQDRPVLAADGAGGAIVAWSDCATTTSIHAQRVAAEGSLLWVEPVLIRAGLGCAYSARIITDGAGGAIVTWQEVGTIRAQRLHSDGKLDWSVDGVPVAPIGSNAYPPEAAADGAGGAFVSWLVSGPSGVALLVQHLDSTGARTWAPSGVIVGSIAAGAHQLMADGSGGVIVVWQDGRNGLTNNVDIFAQHLDANGAAQWTPGGLAICTRSQHQYDPVLTSDGAGGAIFAWEDQGVGFPEGGQWIVVQRVDAGGTVRWAANGIVLTDGRSSSPRLVSDSSGGAFVVWDGIHPLPDYRPAAYAQRVDAAGQLRWSSAGLEFYTLPTGNFGLAPQPVSDGAGGLIALWTDYRFTADSTTDIFAQRINDRVVPPPSLAADLSVSLSASPDPVAVGANLTYVASVTNAGPGTATLVAFNSEIPGGTRLYQVTSSQGECTSPIDGTLITTASCRLGTMAPGASLQVRYVVRAHTALGTITDTAFVASNERDTNAANNEATVTSSIASDGRLPSTSFFTLSPCRLLDTRSPSYGGPALSSGTKRAFRLVDRCGIPPTAISVSVNITVTEATGSGHLTVYPNDITRPTSSSINYSAGQTRANSAVVRLSDGPNNRGVLAIYCGPPDSGEVHVVVDVNGYFE